MCINELSAALCYQELYVLFANACSQAAQQWRPSRCPLQQCMGWAKADNHAGTRAGTITQCWFSKSWVWVPWSQLGFYQPTQQLWRMSFKTGSECPHMTPAFPCQTVFPPQGVISPFLAMEYSVLLKQQTWRNKTSTSSCPLSGSAHIFYAENPRFTLLHLQLWVYISSALEGWSCPMGNGGSSWLTL